LELSSFQLETTANLNATVATILNLSDDHMDRYESFEHYKLSKQRIYFGCKNVVVNREESNDDATFETAQQQISFGLSAPTQGQLGLVQHNQEQFISYGEQRLISTKELRISGQHNYLNAMAAIAIAKLVGISEASMVSCLKKFKGLAHRCEWVTTINNIAFYNDSKATNVGACIAALVGLGSTANGSIVLIAGGDGKGADFTPLVAPVEKYVGTVILFGRDAQKIKTTLDNVAEIFLVEALGDAVSLAWAKASTDDIVLLSPACASLDLFKSYEHRGDAFKQHVRKLEVAG